MAKTATWLTSPHFNLTVLGLFDIDSGVGGF